MKNKLILLIIILSMGINLHALPVAGISGISGNSERATAIAVILEQHILEILKKNNFSTIQPEIINRELTKFNCTGEKCVLKFAEDAELDLIISGNVLDKKNFIIINLESYGIKLPFNKRIIKKYTVKIPMDVNITSREFSLLSEEHSAEFISGTLDIFLYPVYIKSAGEKFILSDDLKISGKFIMYIKSAEGSIKENGEVDISDGIVSPLRGAVTTGENFILHSYKDKSREIHKYYTARKREIVFDKTSFYDTLFMLAVIPFASASMPFSSPVLGYYNNNDWEGLGLWMLNAPPYLYIEAKGFINSPERLKAGKKNITTENKAMNHFAWYMLLSGGMPLFVDSYNSDYLHKASYFTGNNQFLGNNATAAILSLTSNGAGHFYRGHRYWGYFYFHLNNILLYLTMREYSTPEYYDGISSTYIKGDVNRKHGAVFSSVFAISKTVEIIHSILLKENISSGEVIDQYVIPEPLFTLDDKGNPVYGINVTLKF